MNRIPRPASALAGLAGGFLNGIFGAGGGTAAVPVLERAGVPPKNAHAMSVSIMMFVSMVSAVGNIMTGSVPWELLGRVIPAGIAGAAAGALLLRKTDSDLLRRLFGAFIIYSGGRMLLQ